MAEMRRLAVVDEPFPAVEAHTPPQRTTMQPIAILPVLLGAGLGFGWHRFVGCRSGARPVWANPYFSTLYGALPAFLVSR
jgi:hypothetical protein